MLFLRILKMLLYLDKEILFLPALYPNIAITKYKEIFVSKNLDFLFILKNE